MKKIVNPRAAPIRAALVSILLFTVFPNDGLVGTANAQARTPEEQAANGRYHQVDAAYSRATGRPATSATSSANAPPSGPTPAAQNPLRPSCRKHFRIDGTDQILSVAKHFHEFTSDELDGYAKDGRYIKGSKEQWQSKYARGGYEQVPGTHTKNQDCAGYVMNQLWQTGQIFVTAPYLYREVIAKHGQKISGTFGWGDVQPNDIVVWGEAGHVAIVKSADANSIMIETKDGIEPVYRNDLRKVKLGPLGNDPLVIAYGTPHIYRVDPRRVKLTPVSNQDCDQNPAQENPTPRVDQLVAALQGLPQCPGMQLGPVCFQKFSVSKSGLAASTSLAREPAAGSERTDVKLIDWLDQATASRNFKSSYDVRKEKKMSSRSAFESFAIAGQPDAGALEVWLDSNFGGESREAGQAFGVLICGKVVGHLKMFISAGFKGASGPALVDATRTQLKGLLQQIGSALLASGACAA